MYAILSYYQSPIYITHPKNVGYVTTLKEAKRIVKEKNERSVRNSYGYQKLKELK